MKLVRTFMVLAAVGMFMSACGSGREAKGKKPSNVNSGRDETPSGTTTSQQLADEVCTADDIGFCVCVEDGYEADGETWDFFCCDGEGTALLYYCGDDSAGCNADTFACE